MVASGDYYFIQLVRIPHEAVDRNKQLIERRVEVVSTTLWKFFEIADIEQYGSVTDILGYLGEAFGQKIYGFSNQLSPECFAHYA